MDEPFPTREQVLEEAQSELRAALNRGDMKRAMKMGAVVDRIEADPLAFRPIPAHV